MRIPTPVVLLIVAAVIVGGVLVAINAVRTGTVESQPGFPQPAFPAGTIPTGTIPTGSIPSDATPATVDYVHDGDTLFLRDGTKVRLLGIDTPEIGDNLECYGSEATELLRDLLPEGTDVWVLADIRPLDQYGRSLLFIYVDDGDGQNTLVNLEMIERGAAEAVVLEPNLLFASELEAAEDRAQDAGAGMWGTC